MNTKTIRLGILMVVGIAGWSSLFAFTGFEAGNQQLGGIVQVWAKTDEFPGFDGTQNTSYRTSFEMNHVRLWVDGEIVPGYFGYRVEAELARSPELVDVYIRMWATRNLEIKVGRFHPFFTLYGPETVDALESPYYPMIDDYLGPGRQIGIEISRRSRFVQLYVGGFNGSDRPNAWEDSTSSKDVMVRTDVTLLDWTRFVLEGMYGTEPLTSYLNGEHLLAGLALKVDWELTLDLRAEWIRRWREVLWEFSNSAIRAQVSEGVLLHVGYHFTPKLDAMVRYEWFDGDLNRDATWSYGDNLWRERTTLGVGYQIVPGRLCLNGYYIHHTQESRPSWSSYSSPAIGDEAILECQISF